MITKQKRNLLFLSLSLMPISLPFLVSCKSNETSINWYGIRSVKMSVNQNNENQQNQKRIEIRIIVDNNITYDKDKTKIEFIKPNGEKIDSSNFDIILSEDRHEINLYYNYDANFFPKGIYKLKINSTQIVQINFQNDSIDLTKKNPEIMYLEGFNKKEMYINLIGKNLKSVVTEDIVIKNSKDKKISPNSEYFLKQKDDSHIRLAFDNKLAEGTYKIELGNTTAWFDYKKDSSQNAAASLISVEIQDNKTIKLHGRNLSKIFTKQILIENLDDSSQKISFQIFEEEIQNKSITLKLDQQLVGNAKMKISISKEDYIEFRYGTLISKATMTRDEEEQKDKVVVEFEGQNLNFIKDNKEEYSFVFQNVSTNTMTTINSFSIEETQENDKLKISILESKLVSGDFEIYLSYKNTSFISMTKSKLSESLKTKF